MSRGVTFADNFFDDVPSSNSNPITSSSSNHNQHNNHNHNKNQMQCPNCGSTNIAEVEASGESVCTECGVVLEENMIVSSVEFVDGGNGASSRVGQFVGAGKSKAYTGGGGRYGFSRDSRETTLLNGKRRIQDVASRMRLGNQFIDSAHRFYTIAVEKNFVQGRKMMHVTASCLYIACRQEKSQHMLIDFSDALQVNVYTLGTTFLKFRRLLGLYLEIIDPALYVYRFAAHMDLGEKANAVGMTALRVVGRMSRDWMVAGRRPAGICAAALLIASRAHGFDRGKEDVTSVLRVCGMTVGKRVREFEDTPSAHLTLEQFGTVDIASEADPPAYTKNKLNEARAMAIQGGDVGLLTSGALDDPRVGGRWRHKWRDGIKENTQKAEMVGVYEELEVEMIKEVEEGKLPGVKPPPEAEKPMIEDGKVSEEGDEAADKVQGENAETDPENPENETNAENTENEAGASKETDASKETNASKESEEQKEETENDKTDQTPAKKRRKRRSKNTPLPPSEEPTSTALTINTNQPHLTSYYPKGNNGAPLCLPNQATPAELAPGAPNQMEAKISLSDWKTDMPSNHMLEIDLLFRNDEEVKQREAVFNSLNQDYLAKQIQKKEDLLKAEKDRADMNEDELAQLDSQRRYRKRRSKNGEDGEDGDYPTTTEEALMAAVSTRKVSRKINYDAMSAIFDGEGTFTTDLLDDERRGEGGDDEPVFEMV